MSRGTAIRPPPTPKSAENTPATRPMTTRRTSRIVWRCEDRPASASALRPHSPRACWASSRSRPETLAPSRPRTTWCASILGSAPRLSAAATGSPSRTTRARAVTTGSTDRAATSRRRGRKVGRSTTARSCRAGSRVQAIEGFGKLGLLIATDVRNPVGDSGVWLVLPAPRHRSALHSRAVLLDTCLPAERPRNRDALRGST